MNPIINFYKDGKKYSEEYFNDLDEHHNENGPAYISFYENGNILYKCYLLNNKVHNIKGPSRIWYHKNGTIELKEYWLNNKCINVNSDKELLKYIKRLNIS